MELYEDSDEVVRVAARVVAALLREVNALLSSPEGAGITSDGARDGVRVERASIKVTGRKTVVEMELAGLGISSSMVRRNEQPGLRRSPAKDSRATAAAELAQRIAASSKIKLERHHTETPDDGASAFDNIQDTANGQQALRSQPIPPADHPPGGRVDLSPAMLAAVVSLSENFSFTVSEFAGGKHSKASSPHYAGVAFDVTVIDGLQVSDTHPGVARFRAACETLGASQTLGPGDPKHDHHVHAGWPRTILEDDTSCGV